MLIELDPSLGAHAMEWARHPEEGPLMIGLLQGGGDRARRAYADWLLERSDPRGELLALVLDRDPASRERFVRLFLRAGVDPAWWQLVRPPVLTLNCGEAQDLPGPTRFAYACPMLWEQLGATAEPNVRQCSQCEQSVTLCETAAAAEREALAGRCIAVPSSLTEPHAEDMTHKVGRPEHPVHRWARALFAEEPGGDLPDEDR